MTAQNASWCRADTFQKATLDVGSLGHSSIFAAVFRLFQYLHYTKSIAHLTRQKFTCHFPLTIIVTLQTIPSRLAAESGLSIAWLII